MSSPARRRSVRVGTALVAGAAAVALAVAAAGSSATRAATACPLKGGVVRAFQTDDLAGVTDGVGTGAKQALAAWLPVINKQGGLLGCKLEVDQVEEKFPDVQNCLREYRNAIASNKYTFFFGPLN